MKGRRRITAAELLSKLENDPEWKAKMDVKEARRREASAQFQKAARPLLAALRAAGLPVEGFGHFVSARGAKYFGSADFDFGRSVPILLEWLPRIEDLGVKEAIVRSLSTKYARPTALIPLVEEFEKVSEDAPSLKWAIGNALSVVANDDAFEPLMRLAKNPRHGRARQMIVLALGKMRDPRAVDVLVELLDDPDVCGHAVSALAVLAPPRARSFLEPLCDHKVTWIRKAARKAIARIDKKSMVRSPRRPR